MQINGRCHPQIPAYRCPDRKPGHYGYHAGTRKVGLIKGGFQLGPHTLRYSDQNPLSTKPDENAAYRADLQQYAITFVTGFDVDNSGGLDKDEYINTNGPNLRKMVETQVRSASDRQIQANSIVLLDMSKADREAFYQRREAEIQKIIQDILDKINAQTEQIFEFLDLNTDGQITPYEVAAATRFYDGVVHYLIELAEFLIRDSEKLDEALVFRRFVGEVLSESRKIPTLLDNTTELDGHVTDLEDQIVNRLLFSDNYRLIQERIRILAEDLSLKALCELPRLKVPGLES